MCQVEVVFVCLGLIVVSLVHGLAIVALVLVVVFVFVDVVVLLVLVLVLRFFQVTELLGKDSILVCSLVKST